MELDEKALSEIIEHLDAKQLRALSTRLDYESIRKTEKEVAKKSRLTALCSEVSGQPFDYYMAGYEQGKKDSFDKCEEESNEVPAFGTEDFWESVDKLTYDYCTKGRDENNRDTGLKLDKFLSAYEEKEERAVRFIIEVLKENKVQFSPERENDVGFVQKLFDLFYGGKDLRIFQKRFKKDEVFSTVYCIKDNDNNRVVFSLFYSNNKLLVKRADVKNDWWAEIRTSFSYEVRPWRE